MANPFDDQEALYLTLINTDRQLSVWPVFVTIPAGWQTIHGPAPRSEILSRIDMERAHIGAPKTNTALEALS